MRMIVVRKLLIYFKYSLIMKKTGTENKIVIDITSVKSINDVYAKFAIAKFEKLTPAEQDMIKNIIINKYFDDLQDYCDSFNCPDCIEGTIEICANYGKKPNIFKRVWNKLFKRSSK